jgi:HK97 family phage major capsid protein
MSYTNDIIRQGSTLDPLVPDPVVQSIIQGLPGQSAMLSLARTVPMSSKTTRQPVLSALPTAYFLTAETGAGARKQTTDQQWANVTLVAEEIACIVPIPESYFDDAMVPIWAEVRPRITEAIGKLIDAACLYGTSKPSTWSPAIYQTAVGHGNRFTQGTYPDLGADVANMGRILAEDGFQMNGFAVKPGFPWQLVGMRTAQGVPIYQPALQDGVGSTLYGFPLREVTSGGWNSTETSMIAGDWSNAIIGMRQDVSFRVFTEGVITDGSNAIVLNLMQQDHIALRVTMRLAFATSNPVNALNANAGTRYPFAVLQPAGYTYS